MSKTKLMKKSAKGFVSVLLVLAVMLSLFVPFDLTVFAEEEPATGNDIYALLYDIRSTPTANNWGGYELVIQRGNTADADVNTTNTTQGTKRRVHVCTYPYNQFGASSFKMTNAEVQARTPWYRQTPETAKTPAGADLPGKGCGNNSERLSKLITKITIKDKIKPESIAGWFYYCDYATEINNLEKINTSICTDMRYAFYSVGSIKKLDLHTFNTSNVEKIDYFIYSSNALEEVDVSGFDLSKVQTLTTFIKGGYKSSDGTYKCCKLNKVNFSGMNIENIRETQYFLTYTNDLEEIEFDLNPRNAKDFMYAFQYNRGLKKFKLGTQGHPFQPGIDYPLDYHSDDNQTYNRLVRLNGMFEGCVSLEEIDFTYTDMPEKLTNGKESQYLDHSRHYEYASFFKNCSSLTTLTKLDNLFLRFQASGNYIHRAMFDGCESLETLDLSKIHGMLGGPWIFRNCSSLRTLDLRNLGTDFDRHTWTVSNGLRFQATDNGVEQNIYDGCTELSEVYLSPYYPPANKYFYSGGNYIGHGKTVPPVEREWVKVNLPWDYYDGDWDDFTNTHTYNKRDTSSSRVKLNTLTFSAKGDGKDTSTLFESFEPEYAGRWVAVSKIYLKANGGAPATQSFKGAIDNDVNYNDEEITEPTRNGYHFAGWYSEKENGKGVELQKGQPAASWTYYAHWNENHYTLKLNGNGGTTVKDNETVNEYTAKDSLGYAEFFELSNKMFTREGYVLSGWNTRPNGMGDEFAANDSVNKLAENDGGEAVLYAQWHKPDVIITFDSQGGSAVNNKEYTLKTGEGENTYYGALAESTRENYTFLGWYTEPNGGGDHIVNKADNNLGKNEQNKVTKSRTLYAYWAENPTINFDANGYDSNNQPVAYFNDNVNQHVLPKRYNYGQKLGVLPTPQYGSAVLKGWYTSATPGEGTEVTSAATATASATYYAHWGYKPQFETDGGTYTNFPEYLKDVQEESAEYKITELPAVTKDNYTFNGWMFGDLNLTQELADAIEAHAQDPEKPASITVDLSSGGVVVADWTENDHYTVTLNPNGGSLKSGTINPINVYKGKQIGELPTPTKSGYDFLGWYTDVNNETTRHTYKSVINSNVTLTAKWAADEYTVTFDPNGGELFDAVHDASQKVAAGKPVKTLPGANRSDSTTSYSLDGWYYKDSNNEEHKLTSNTAITAELVGSNNTLDCYAKWTAASALFEEPQDNLYGYVVKWYTQSNTYATNIGDNLVISPESGNDKLSAMLFIEFDFHEQVSKTQGKTLPKNSVKILIPKYVFKDKDGNGIGTNNIGAGLFKTPGEYTNDNKCSFIYSDNDTNYPDYYVVTNYEELKEGVNQNQMFKITYELTPAQIRSVNGGYTDENGYYRYVGDDTVNTNDDQKYYQANIPVKIMVDRNVDGDYADENETDYTKSPGIEMHTKVNAAAQKTQANASFGWNDDWGDEPDDADQYFYITWTLTADFDSSSSQKFKFTWDESTVHDGSVVYVRSNNGNDWLTNGIYKTTVVTKHSRKPKDSGWKSIYNEAILDVEWLSGHHEEYRVSHTAGVYLLPKGDLQFEKYVENYNETPERFKKGAQDKILARQSVNSLPYEISYCEYKNTDNPAWNESTKKYTAPERDIVITDGNKGDVVISTVKGNDRYNWNSSTNLTLSDSDYCFDRMTVYMTEFDAAKVKTTVNNEEVWEWSEPYKHSPYADYTDVEIWTRTEGEDEYKLFKTLKDDDFSATVDNTSTPKDERDTYGVVNASVELPEKTVGYKVRHKSEFFTSKLFINANMVLKSSNKVLQQVRDDVSAGYETLVKNNCTLNVNDKPAMESKDLESGGASICSYELSIGNSYICADARCQTAKLSDIKGNFEEFSALICGWGYTDTEDTLKLLDSGEFNDLLPYNFTVDKNSVYVVPITHNLDGTSTITVPERDDPSSTKTIKATIGNYVAINQYDNAYFQSLAIPSAYYSVDFQEDWEGSGRTMMTIKVDTPDDVQAAGYFVFFKMKTPLSNISANGITQTNYVSFTDTTENQSPPLAQQSNLKNGIDKKYAQYYNSIDDIYTAYNRGNTSLITPSQYATGIKSQVKSEGEFVSKDVTVGLDSDYTYNVTFSNNQPAGNIVIYDVLVNSLNGQSYDWNGDFKSVDISSLTSDELVSEADSTAHMAPKVWYCIKDGDLVESDLDISKTDIWTEDEPADKSTIKAIAVDCRKDEKGNNYSLKQEASISFNIQMHSPTSHDVNDVYTYNEAHVFGTISNEPFKNVTLTSVLLHYATPRFSKSAFPESGVKENNVLTGGDVVNKSVINYNLEITNPDETIAIHNVVVEDLLDSHLTINSTAKVQIGNEEPVAINKAPIVSSYEVTEDSSNNNRTRFKTTIKSLAPKQTITIIVPATVNADLNTEIDNTAVITSYNGIESDIQSETTYHYVTVTHAKIKKVDSKDEGLEGAMLEVYKNNSTNCNTDGTLKYTTGDDPVPTGTPETVNVGGNGVTQFTSTNDVITFELAPGDYILHEVSAPATYNKSADIPFTIDIEGITHVNGEAVNYVKMVDEPAFKIIFHENKPGGTIDERNKEFRIYEPKDLVNDKVTHFYDIPEWAGDEYVFAGWYYRSSPAYRIYKDASSIDKNVDTPAIFESNTFSGANSANYTGKDGNYHLYAKWIPVGTVDKATGEGGGTADTNDYGDYPIRGFGLAGVQVRKPYMGDSNYGDVEQPAGMRFVTSLSESLYSQIDALSGTDVDGVPVEYGYVVGTENNINTWIGKDHYNVKDPSKYKLQYYGENVNGVDTTVKGSAETDYRYIKNVKCTSNVGSNGGSVNGVVPLDHENFDNYRLYTLVVYYDNEEQNKDKKLDARAYIRYYDANGKLRVFYNNYDGNKYYGGCMCSFKLVSTMALGSSAEN